MLAPDYYRIHLRLLRLLDLAIDLFVGTGLTEWIDQMDFGQPSLKTKQFGSTAAKMTEKNWSIVVFMAD